MNFQDKSKEELIVELHDVLKNYDILKETLEKSVDKKRILDRLIEASRKFIQNDTEKPDYQEIAQFMHEISGAKYSVVNIFDDNGLDFTTVAFEGVKEQIKKGLALLGLDLINKHWNHDPIRAEKTKLQTITLFENLHELSGNIISKNAITLVEKTFNIGKTYVVKVQKDDKVLGDFTLLFGKGEIIQNSQFVELQALQVGMFLDRLKTMDIIRKSEERHRSILNTTMDGFWTISVADKKITSANESYCRMSGYTKDELLTMYIHDLDASQTHDEMAFTIQKTITDGSYVFETRHRHKNGNIFDVEISVTFQKNTNGEEFICFCRDITKRKRVELEREALFEITHGFTTTSNLNELLNLMHQSLSKVIYAGNIFVALYNQKTELFEFPYLVDKFDPSPEPAAIPKSCSAYVYRSGEPLLLSQELFDALEAQDEVELIGVNSPSWLGVPLKTPEKTIGVLVVQHYEEENVFSQQDVQFLESVGSQMAIAIERKRTEDELYESEEMFRRLFDESTDPILFLDETGFTNCNQSTVSLLNYSNKTEFLLKKPWEISPEKQPDGLLSSEKATMMIDKAIAEGYNRFEWIHTKSDGSDVPVEVMLTPMKFKGKQILYTIWRDITERKKAEMALYESEEKYRLIFENSPLGLLLFDEKGVILACNNNFVRIIGSSQKVLIGLNMLNLSDEKLVSAVQLALQGETGVYEDDYHSVTSSKVTPIRAIFTQVNVGNRYFHGGVGIVEDITLRKQADAEIKKTNEELQRLNAQKDKFFSIIAHDLKSPFNSIVGFSERLVEQINENDFNSIGKYAGIILQSSERAMDLLSNLMEWSRSQTGRMEFNPEFIEMVEMINDASDLLAYSAEQKLINIILDLPSNAPVYADKDMINTVLRNLISNAIKFTRPDGEIIISAKEDHEGFMVTVSDNGIGISKSSMEKLFRIDESYSTPGTRNEKGTGLGLILCKEFIEKHGGKIWVESEVMKGSTFYFTLPSKI